MAKYVYASGPIANTDYVGATDWYVRAQEMMLPGLRLIRPMRGKEFLAAHEGGLASVALKNPSESPVLTDRGITNRDHWDCRTADAVLMHLGATPNQASIGCMIELGWANAHGVPVVLSADADNIHSLHPIVRGAVTYHVPTLSEAVMLLNTMFCDDD